MRILGVQLRVDCLDTKPERRDCISLDMCKDEMLDILGEGC